MFGLSPMQSAGIIIANSVAGKMYLTSWRLADPEGSPVTVYTRWSLGSTPDSRTY